MHELNLGAANRCAPWEHLTKRTYRFDGCTVSATAFQSNIERVNGLLVLPGYAFKSGGEWQVAVQGVANRFFGKEMPSNEDFETHRQEIAAIANVARQTALSQQSAKASMNVFYTACHNIEVFANDFPMLHEWLHDILKTALIQSWTAFEVLCEDLWKAVVTTYPALESSLTPKQRRELGFRSRNKIRLAYQTTFKTNDAAIKSALESSSIDSLAVLRNVIVHAGGKVDPSFTKDSAALAELDQLRALPSGMPIPFEGCFVRSVIDRVVPCGFALIRAVDDWLTTNPPPK